MSNNNLNKILAGMGKFSFGPAAVASSSEANAAQAIADQAAVQAAAAQSLANQLHDMSIGAPRGKRAATRSSNTSMSQAGISRRHRGNAVEFNKNALNRILSAKRKQKSQHSMALNRPKNQGPKLTLKQKAALKKQKNANARAAASHAQANAFKQSMAAQYAQMGPSLNFAPNLHTHSRALVRSMATNWAHAPHSMYSGKATRRRKHKVKKMY